MDTRQIDEERVKWIHTMAFRICYQIGCDSLKPVNKYPNQIKDPVVDLFQYQRRERLQFEDYQNKLLITLEELGSSIDFDHMERITSITIVPLKTQVFRCRQIGIAKGHQKFETQTYKKGEWEHYLEEVIYARIADFYLKLEENYKKLEEETLIQEYNKFSFISDKGIFG